MRMITVDEAAQMLAVSPRMVRGMIRAGRFPSATLVTGEANQQTGRGRGRQWSMLDHDVEQEIVRRQAVAEGAIDTRADGEKVERLPEYADARRPWTEGA